MQLLVSEARNCTSVLNLYLSHKLVLKGQFPKWFETGGNIEVKKTKRIEWYFKDGAFWCLWSLKQIYDRNRTSMYRNGNRQISIFWSLRWGQQTNMAVGPYTTILLIHINVTLTNVVTYGRCYQAHGSSSKRGKRWGGPSIWHRIAPSMSRAHVP